MGLAINKLQATLLAATTMATLASPASAVVYKQLNPLGGAAQFSGFFYDNVTGGNDVEGRLAVGGNINSTTLKSVGFRDNSGKAALVVRSDIQSAPSIDLYKAPAGVDTNKSKGPSAAQSEYKFEKSYGIIGGKVKATDGQLHEGDASAGTKYGWDSADIKDVNAAVMDEVDFVGVKDFTSKMSSFMDKLAANGTTKVENGGITLLGNGAKTQVFDLDGIALTSWGQGSSTTRDGLLSNLVLTGIGSDSTVIINYSGTNASFNDVIFAGGQGGQLEAKRANVLFNFVNAKEVTINTEVFGSILAPKATIFGTGHVEGTIVANRLAGQVEIGYEPFIGAVVTPVPEPETYALMGLGLMGLLVVRRRKNRE